MSEVQRELFKCQILIYQLSTMWLSSVAMWQHWPVDAEGAQVEHCDAHRCFLQEGNKLTKAQAHNAVIEWEAWCQELENIEKKERI